MKLKDRICIVTGGARGIGKEICKTLKSMGASVYIFDLNDSEGAETEKELNGIKSPGEACYMKVNVTSEKDVNAAVENIINKNGKIDILVNNAGITRDGLIMRMGIDDWNTVIGINLTGSFLCY